VATNLIRRTARLAGTGAILVAVGVGAAGAAQQGDSLRVQARNLDTKAHRALLDMVALDTRLNAAQTRLATLDAEKSQLREEQLVLELRLATTRHTLELSRRQLGSNLSMLYKVGDVSTIAVVLGSQSLNDAVTRLDDLDRVATQSKQVVRETIDAQSRLGRLRATLRARAATLAAAIVETRRTASSLAAARADRAGLVATLRRKEQLKLAQIRALQTTARRVVHASAAIQASAPEPVQTSAAQAPAPAPAPADGRTLTVSATGYSLPGRTATGLPVGWGVVAVDPSVIPLGTRLTIPGYGDAVAADVGSAVRGAEIDLWFPTLAQARAWGRRTVTVTLH
jgi:3D (Asp-Asp-Asp) domain-containing protein